MIEAFHYSKAPLQHDLCELDERLREEAIDLAVSQVGNLRNSEGLSVAAGRLYDRKGYASFDELMEHRNTAYGRASDDVVIYLALRVSSAEAEGLVARAAELKESDEEAARQALKLVIDAKIAALEAERSTL